MCRVWAQDAGLGSGEVARTDDTQGQTYPLIQIEGLRGAGQREEEERTVNDPQVLPPVPAPGLGLEENSEVAWKDAPGTPEPSGVSPSCKWVS